MAGGRAAVVSPSAGCGLFGDELVMGPTDFNGHVSQCQTLIGAFGDDPSTHQESATHKPIDNPRPKGRRLSTE